MTKTESSIVTSGSAESGRNSPYFLASSDNPGVSITPVALNGENYAEWASELENALRAKRKMGFINGTLPKPDEKEKPEEAEQWRTVNSMIVGWIRASISPAIRSTVTFTADARKMWDDLKKRFSVGNSVRVHQLKAELAACKQDGASVKFSEEKVTGHRIEEVYNDIVLSARMSNHNNFLKLLGCSLEFPFPVLVFEFASNGVLNERGGISVNGRESLLPWGLRLKIGKEIANAVTYLHMAFPKIIIHRDVKPMHVFLDSNWTVKLSDLSFSISLPEGKTRIEAERILGTFGYLDPLYHATSFVTEYTDVYSFGICLLVFLTGKPVVITGSDGDPQGILIYVKGLRENGKVDEVIDPMIAKDITSGQKSQVEMCVGLALRCCQERDEYRPKMIQVAKELKLIEASLRYSS